MRACEHNMNGSFDDLPDDVKETVMEIVANFHYRTGVKHDDGSRGEIKITPGGLNHSSFRTTGWNP